MFLSGPVNHKFEKMARPNSEFPLGDSVNAATPPPRDTRWIPSYECKVVDVKHEGNGSGSAGCFDWCPLGKIRFWSREPGARTWRQRGCTVHPVPAARTLSGGRDLEFLRLVGYCHPSEGDPLILGASRLPLLQK